MKRVIYILLLQALTQQRRITQQPGQEGVQTDGPEDGKNSTSLSLNRLRSYKVIIKNMFTGAELKGTFTVIADDKGINTGNIIIFEQNYYPSPIERIDYKFNKSEYVNIDTTTDQITYNPKINYTKSTKIIAGSDTKGYTNLTSQFSFNMNGESINEDIAFITSSVVSTRLSTTEESTGILSIRVVEYKAYALILHIILASFLYCIIFVCIGFCGNICFSIATIRKTSGTLNYFHGYSLISTLLIFIFSIVIWIAKGFKLGVMGCTITSVISIIGIITSMRFDVLIEKKYSCLVVFCLSLLFCVIPLILGEKNYLFYCFSLHIGYFFDIYYSNGNKKIIGYAVFITSLMYTLLLQDYFYGPILVFFAHPVSLTQFIVFCLVYIIGQTLTCLSYLIGKGILKLYEKYQDSKFKSRNTRENDNNQTKVEKEKVEFEGKKNSKAKGDIKLGIIFNIILIHRR